MPPSSLPFTKRVPRRARLLTLAIAVAAVAASLPSSTAQATPVGTDTTTPALTAAVAGATPESSLLVGVAPSTSAATQDAIAQTAGARKAARLSRSVLEVQVAPGTTEQQAARLRRRDDVRYVEPNTAIHASATPNDPGFVEQWPLQNAAPGIGAPTAWNRTTGSPGIVVGVQGSGIDLTHPDLVANLWSNPGGVGGCAAGTHGVNEVDGGCVPQDGYGHGTHVAGTIGAVGNNHAGVTGVNWSTRLMSLRMLDDTGSGSIASAVAAIEFAVQAKTQSGVNVRVLNASWGDEGGQPPSAALKSAIQDAGNAGILFVSAAGNGDIGANLDQSPEYPCSFHLANMICVAATSNNPADTLASFSNYGASTVDVAAPGVDVVSTWPTSLGGQYASQSGTSMATPHVSGAAALMLAARDMSVGTLKTLLLANAAPVPALAGRVTTGSRLDLACAVGAIAAHWCAFDTPTTLSGGLSSAPAIASWAPGRLDVFARNASGQLAHTWSTGAFSNWENLGGGLVGAPATVAWAPGRLDVFARGTDNQLWHRWYAGGWSGWEPLGGVLGSAPTVSSWGSGRLDVFVRGSDGQLWQRSFVAGLGWGPWGTLGGQLGGDPGAVSWGFGRIDVFVRGTDGQVWQRFMNGGAWTGAWIPLGGQAVGGTAASSRGAGRLDVFVTGTDGRLWHKWYDAGWHGYEPLGGTLTTGPAAVSRNGSRIDVVSRGTNNQLTRTVWR